ncbi:MAG: hypothetical protein KIT87_30320, partial [Anaerolineae bacterium]|nr:hypothetical protein [Anaerolineae bacterium]
GRAGLILLISPLNPLLLGTPTQEEVRRRRVEVRETARRLRDTDEIQLKGNDFLPLLNTNLEPALRALEFHYQARTLRDCWMISTCDVQGPDGEVVKGSAWICPLLQKWFRALHPGTTIEFYYEGYEVAPRAYGQIWRKVDSIFRISHLRPSQIICDITGGTKLMSIGAALACIADGRNMQYMASDRDWRGEPIERGTLVPVLVDVTPYLSLPGADES